MAKQISAPYIECSAQQSENSVRDIFHIATLACISKSNKNVKRMKSSRATKRTSHVSNRPELDSVSRLHKTKTKTCTVMWFQKPFHLHAFLLLPGFLLKVHWENEWDMNWREIFCTSLIFTICTTELSERHVLMMMHSILPYLKAPQNILGIIKNLKQGKHLFICTAKWALITFRSCPKKNFLWILCCYISLQCTPVYGRK